MKHVLLIAAFVTLLFSPAAAFGQTPPPARPTYDPYDLSNYTRQAPRCAWWEYWCSESVYRNPNVSPVTKKKLYDNDPSICHTDECRRLRLAAGIEYMGIDIPRVHVPPPTPLDATRYQPYEPYIYCPGKGMVRKSLCPGR